MASKKATRERSGLQVIGAGLPRTGTNSLMKALEILGFAPCHHTETIADERYPYPSSRLWQEACVTVDRPKRQKILKGLYDGGGFRSGCDYPTALFVDDLVDMYPEAKVLMPTLFLHRAFILGVRSTAEAWRKSVNETIALTASPALYYACWLFPPMRLNLSPLLKNGQLCDRRRHDGVDVFEPKDSVEIYHRHNEWVRKVVPKDRLLQFNPAEGWQPLCNFIDVPVPRDADGNLVEYPRTNDSAVYRRMFAILMLVGVTSWALLFGTIYLVTTYLWKRFG